MQELEQEIRRNDDEKTDLTNSNDYLETIGNLNRIKNKHDFILNNILDIILELDEKGTIIFINPQVENLFGFKPDKVLGKNALKFVHPEDLNYVLKSIQNAFLYNEDFGIEYRSIHKNGQYIPVYAKGIIRCVENKKSSFLIIRDISKQKQIERKFIESEEKWRKIFENSPNAILLIDIKAYIIDCNSSTKKLFGFGKKELMGKNILKISAIPNEFMPIVLKGFKTLQKGGIPEPQEIQLYTREGKRAWFYCQISLVKSNDENLIQLTIQDLRLLKKARKKLEDYEKNFQVLFNNSTSGIAYHRVVYDNLGNPVNYVITDVNPKYEKILLIKKEDVINRTATEAYNVEKAPYLGLYSKVADNQESITFETYFTSMDTHFRISAISPRKGEFITVFDDISERKNSELKLVESEEKFRTITEQSFIGIAILQDFTFKYVNKQFSDTLGYSSDDILKWKPREFFQIIHPEDKEMVQTIAEEKYYRTKGVLANIQFRVIKKTGKIIWLEIISKTITFKGKPADLIATLDISEKIEAEWLILEENKKLLRLNKIRKDLITRVSHELKTPLTSMYGASQILLKHLIDKIDEDVLRFIEIFHRGALRLKKLIESLIDASRIETGKLELRLNNENLVEIIRECVDEMNYLSNNRYQTINIDLPKDCYLNVDIIRIQQVITNILSNAIKNSPENSSIYINLLENNRNVDINIKDNGIGITKEEKSLLFEKFGKMERYGMDLGVDIEGSGLGLYISKEIIDLHGGQILVESEGRNKGALFTVRLFKN